MDTEDTLYFCIAWYTPRVYDFDWIWGRDAPALEKADISTLEEAWEAAQGQE